MTDEGSIENVVNLVINWLTGWQILHKKGVGDRLRISCHSDICFLRFWQRDYSHSRSLLGLRYYFTTWEETDIFFPRLL